MEELPSEGIEFSKVLAGRKNFNTWSVPTKLRLDYDISDGNKIRVAFTIDNESFCETLKVTSGGEFRVKNFLADKIKATRQEMINFTLFNEKEYERVKNDGELEELNRKLLEDVVSSLSDNPKKRRKRLQNAPKIPNSFYAIVQLFSRNPDVIAEVLFLAEGRCQKCNELAPFKRRRDGSPYLEVHHRVPLADGGEDTVANAVALCPNCHRMAHHG